MASCVENISTKNYQNVIIGFQVTVKNVEDAFLDTVQYHSTREREAQSAVIASHSAQYTHIDLFAKCRKKDRQTLTAKTQINKQTDKQSDNVQ